MTKTIEKTVSDLNKAVDRLIGNPANPVPSAPSRTQPLKNTCDVEELQKLAQKYAHLQRRHDQMVARLRQLLTKIKEKHHE